MDDQISSPHSIDQEGHNGPPALPGEDLDSLRSARDAAIRAAQEAVYNTTRLTRFLSVLSVPAPLESLLDHLLQTMSELFSADVVALLDPVGTGSFCPLAALGIPEDLARNAFSEDVGGYVIETMERAAPILVPQARPDPKLDPHLRDLEIESAVWIPISGNSSPRGVLFLARCQPVPFERTDVALLTTMAYRIGPVLEQAQHGIQIELIEQVGRKLGRHLDQSAICVEAVRNLHPILGANASLLTLLGSERGAWVITHEGLEDINEPEWEVLTRRCLLQNDFSDHAPAYIPSEDLAETNLARRAVKTLFAIPILIEGCVQGILFAIRYSSIPFGPDALKIARLYAGQTSAALENAGLYQKVRQELSRRQQAEEALANLAFHDVLTGLANRAFFIKRLQTSLTQARETLEAVALIFLDLDNFKIFNDSLGHETGDEVLKVVAQRISACMRPYDLAARLGGDEFTILIENIQKTEQIFPIAQRLISGLREPIHLVGRELYVNCSMGIAISAPGEDHPENLLRKADLAMYEAKGKGKGCYVIYDAMMNDRAIARLEMETELRLALQRSELKVAYQPIVSLSGGGLVEVEALLRWKHPHRGAISPVEIIPLAEETGLIFEIGQWVLQESCLRIQDWNARHPQPRPIALSVNLSARQLHSNNLVETVRQIVQRNAMRPCSLILEITESSLIHDSDTTIARLRALKEIGVRLAVDDFGIGFASLNYLKKFPVDVLKIDHSFIQGIVNDPRDKAIVRNMIDLGKAFGLEVIGEGIETEAQAIQLAALGCALGQGYLYSQPLAPEEFENRFFR